MKEFKVNNTSYGVFQLIPFSNLLSSSLSLDLSVTHVAGDTNAHKMWHKISASYERKDALNKTSLMRKIVRLKYKDGESIVVHINTFMGLANQLPAARFPLDGDMQALLLLCTLSDNWENLVVSSRVKEENLSLQVVKTSILNEETKRKDKGVFPQLQVNVAQ